MSEQLDWLARNVHEWGAVAAKWIPEDTIGKLRFDGDVVEFEPSRVMRVCRVTRQQWLDRRAELQGKPSWEDAPKWATHLAQQVTGDWMWCDGEPTAGEDGGWFGCFNRSTHGEVLGGWRDTLECRPIPVDARLTSISVALFKGVPPSEASTGFAAVGDALRGEQPLSRADALRWAVENIKTWPTVERAVPPTSGKTPTGWAWQQCGGRLYLARNGNPLISEREWSRHVEQSYEEFASVEDVRPLNCRCVVRPFKPVLHTIHHAAFLHHGCQLLLNEPKLVVFRTADGELIHCKPKECLIDPDQYGLAARLLSDMSGYAVAPEHIRELVEQMGWAV